MNFKGFHVPDQNWSKLPHEFIDQLHTIQTLGELACVLYVLRHTWGFSEFGILKKITTDEFMLGRKRKDGSRIDHGTGLSNKTVIAGLSDAVDHGFLIVTTNDRDKARIKKYYALNMDASYVESTQLDVESTQLDVESTYRTEKETIQKDTSSKTLENSAKNPKNSPILPKGNKATHSPAKPKIEQGKNQRQGPKDHLDTLLAWEVMALEGKRTGTGWKQRFQFENTSPEMLRLADQTVLLFGEPSKSEVFPMLQALNNLIDNKVTPMDLRNAVAKAKATWTIKPSSVSEGIIKLARTCAIERIEEDAKNSESANQDENLKRLANVVNSR